MAVRLSCSFKGTMHGLAGECYQHYFGTWKQQTGKVVGVAMRTALNGGGADRLKLLQEAATLCQFSHLYCTECHTQRIR